MATRIILRRATGIGTTETQVGDAIIPPTGVRWTVVEVRPRFSGPGTLRGKFDDELYHEIRSTVTPGSYLLPHVVALDVVSPHKYVLTAFADTGTIDVEVEITVEEAPLGGAPA